MNALTLQEREHKAASFFPSSFSYKISWLFYATGLFFFGSGIAYQFIWSAILHRLYDAPVSGDRVVSAAEIMAARLPLNLVMNGGTYLLVSLGAGFICMGLLGYLAIAAERRLGERKCAAAGLDAGAVRAGIRMGKKEWVNVCPERFVHRTFTDKTCAVSFMLSVALLVSACLHQLLWGRAFDQFVGTSAKLPAELLMHGGSFLLIGLCAGAFCVASVGMMGALFSATKTAVYRSRERTHD